jgi:ABC-type glycerol-3-phosphate transport system permease component
MATATSLGETAARVLGRRARSPARAGTRRLAGLGRWLALVPLGLVTVVMVGPFLWTVVLSFRLTNEIYANPYALPRPPHLYNYVYALLPPKPDLVRLGQALGVQPAEVEAWLRDLKLENGGFGFLTYVWNSVLVVVPALLLVTALTTMAAYAFARRRYAFPGRGLVFALVFLSMLFPPQVTLLSLYQLTVAYRLYNTHWALILVYPATALAFNIYLLRAFFAQIPAEIEDAARIDGCDDWQTFWRVMLPIAWPAVATTLILNFNAFWNEFLYALTLLTNRALHTIPLASWRWVGEYYLDVGGLAAGLVVSMLPIVVLYLLLSEQFMRGMAAGALKG